MCKEAATIRSNKLNYMNAVRLTMDSRLKEVILHKKV